jgi:raffinose/stachyose/melibiose transport system substrate-binding protein
MKKMALLISVLLVFSIVLGSCTPQASSTPPDTAGGGKPANTQSSASGNKPVTITYLSWHNETTLKPIIDAFNEKYPHITIDLQYAPPIQDYVEKAKVLFLAGETPDVFVTAAENKREVIENGYAIDITHLPVFNRMSDTFKYTYAQDGKIYAFAPDAWIGGIYYNVKLFQQAGVTVPNSYDEFLVVLQKLKDAGIKPIAFSKDNLYDIPQALFITETIDKIPDYDAQVNDGKMTYVEGWSKPYRMWYDDFIQKGFVTKDMLGITGEQVVDEFTTEQVAMMIGGPWNLESFEQKNPDLEFDMMPFVGTEPGVKWNIGAVGVGFSVGKDAKYSEEGMKYLEFLSSDEGLALFQKATSAILGVDGIEYTLHPVFERLKPQAVQGLFYLPAVTWKYSEAMGQIMLKGSQDILAGVLEPEEVARQMDEKRLELDAQK